MLNQRDIVLVPVPFSDLTAVKRRPVLVISSKDHNARNGDVIVAAITSNLVTPGTGRTIDSADLESGHLSHVSRIRSDKIYTLHESIVIKRLGILNAAPFMDVLDALDTVLGRTRPAQLPNTSE